MPSLNFFLSFSPPPSQECHEADAPPLYSEMGEGKKGVKGHKGEMWLKSIGRRRKRKVGGVLLCCCCRSRQMHFLHSSRASRLLWNLHLSAFSSSVRADSHSKEEALQTLTNSSLSCLHLEISWRQQTVASLHLLVRCWVIFTASFRFWAFPGVHLVCFILVGFSL